ncbi:MAG TPA: AmmeMemoRadiSam system radical SAM enzyme [Armatimonadetes bacterium]|nr:AmmeMemoRadiSam system radical SAM enzyme [Armatimonadota bacterium]
MRVVSKVTGPRRYPAKYWKPLPGRKVKCTLCPNYCVIPEGRRGICKVRENRGGRLYTLTYGQPVTFHFETMEKQPLLHYLPGARVLALGTAGCNLGCLYCQNWQFAQAYPEFVTLYDLSPEKVVRLARKGRCRAISFTYNDPVVCIEYVLDVAKLAHKVGIRVVAVTGGYINPRPLRDMCHAVDAFKVDLKGFSEDFYRRVVKGRLKPVLEGMRIVKRSGKWLEAVYLVVPRANDSLGMVRRTARWVRENLGPETPLIFSRFWPKYKMKNLPPTPVDTLERCISIARKEGLKFVYIGNIPGHPAEDTRCPRCGRVVVDRQGARVRRLLLRGGRCPFCGARIPGVWR